MPLNDVLSAYFFYYYFFFSVHTSHWQQSSSHEPVADNVDLVGRLLECQITSFVLHGIHRRGRLALWPTLGAD